jgi:uncharacterized membrane protein YhaH (DUF805 family)
MVGVVSLIFFAGLWLFSFATFSSEPAPIAAAHIEGTYVQATVQANDFSTATTDLVVHVALKATPDIVTTRGVLREPLIIRITDNQGATQTKFPAGTPLSILDATINMDGSPNQYPFDEYSGSFSIEVERLDVNSVAHAVPLSIGTEHARTGWNTVYRINHSTTAEVKVTVITMKREDFTVAFSILLALLMILLTLMAILVGVMCITNQRESDPGIVGWLVALLFALPFVRDMLPGSPPLGCLFDVLVFAWCIALAMLSVLLSLIAWIRQSSAKLKAERGRLR